MQESFAAFAHAHALGVTFSFWPHHDGYRTYNYFHSLSHARQFVFDKVDVPSFEHQSLGTIQSSHDLCFTEVVGRPFSDQTVWAIPRKGMPPDGHLTPSGFPTVITRLGPRRLERGSVSPGRQGLRPKRFTLPLLQL